jgi:D-alanyl-D-alanine carboxypeptidase/D-alanyl-D-alanine-endopeptidase (penicillin-binding protein 4)
MLGRIYGLIVDLNSDSKMPKTRSLTAALSASLLTLLVGCSTANSPKTTTSAPLSEASPSPMNPNDALSVAAKTVPLVLPAEIANIVTPLIDQYVNTLASQGFARDSQGVWIQTRDTLLANHQGTVPLPAASITKVATTLAALSTFGTERQFVTLIGATGPIENGVLEGDLVVQGGEDPLFVWEEAIAIGNLLNQSGIKQVTGSLIIVDKFYMNFESDPMKSGNLLKQGLNAQTWSAEALSQYQTLPPGTPRPQVAIAGGVQVASSLPANVEPIVRHTSYPLAELLKKMNSYSNNKMAQMLADSVGGAKVVAQKAASAAGVPPAEISLINGSGLGEENRISPRAAVAMFLAIERYLQPSGMTVADVFTVVGQDEGILSQRSLPPLAVVKSGSLNRVSSLAGALPTQQQGTIWFAIMNAGGSLQMFRTEQESLLRGLVTQWGAVSSPPVELTPDLARKSKTSQSKLLK